MCILAGASKELQRGMGGWGLCLWGPELGDKIFSSRSIYCHHRHSLLFMKILKNPAQIRDGIQSLFSTEFTGI